MTSAAPRSYARDSDLSEVSALMMKTGISSIYLLSTRYSSTPNPSITGIMMSSRTAHSLSLFFSNSSIARLPFSASTTLRSLNVSLSISRLNSKSSTMSRVLRSSIYVSPLRMPVGK